VLCQAVGKPQLDQRLARYPQAARLPIDGLHHPYRKVHVDALRFSARTPGFAEIELIPDLLTGVELAIKARRFLSSSLS
jgi:hypothetical protein